MILVGVSLVRLVFIGGQPWLGPYTEPEHKISMIGAWFPGIPASERERMRVEGVDFAAGRFLTFSGPPVCSSIDERLEERATTRPWNAVAVLSHALGQSAQRNTRPIAAADAAVATGP